MAVLTEFHVPVDEFVLADTLKAAPDIRIEIKRVVAGSAIVTPYFWAFGDDLDTFDEALRRDSNLQDVLTLEETQDDERFYRVTWRERIPTILQAISDAKATILEAVTEDGGVWELKVLFAEREDLSRFRDFCNANAIEFTLERVYQADNPEERGEYNITTAQQEAVEAAYRGGYFNVPRDVSLAELADQLDISRNAFSARLRRGLRNILSSTIEHTGDHTE